LTTAAIPLAFWTVRLKSPGLDRLAGDLSYVVYLLHISGFLIVNYCRGSLSRGERLPYVLTSIVLTYGAIVLVLWFHDRPIERRRERFVERMLEAGSAAIKTPATESGVDLVLTPEVTDGRQIIVDCR
jgi:peptidoglycan/LPS O-acetylase OafA/YrhL